MNSYFHFAVPLKYQSFFSLNRFIIVEISRTMIDWPANWTASVYLQPKSSLLEHSVEYLSYDPNVCGLVQS